MGLFTARDANFYGTHFYLYTSWFDAQGRTSARRGSPSSRATTSLIARRRASSSTASVGAGSTPLGIVNGNAETSPDRRCRRATSASVGMGQDSGRHDFYLQLAYKIGGLPFDRSLEEPERRLTTGAEFWRDDSLTFSLFGYSGTAEITHRRSGGTSPGEGEDDFWRLGVGVQKQIGDLSLVGRLHRGRATTTPTAT